MIRVLYTGTFRFPDGDAAALRVRAVGDLFGRAGCSVAFAGWEGYRPEGAHYRYKGHDCYSQAEFREQRRGPFGRLSGFLLRGSKTLGWLTRNRRFDVVVAYNPPALFALGLLLLARWWSIRVVLDSTEWYEGEHLPGGAYGPAALENWVRMRLVYPLFRHVICISRFLERHFDGRNVVNIPPLGDLVPIPAARPAVSAGVFFIYAGDAGKKDRLLPFVESLPALQLALQRPVLLRIAGLEREALCKAMRAAGMAVDTYLPYVECRGRVSRDEVMHLYGMSHFSVLFREDKRYARAGFPTKAVESWSCGCPIIANRVGVLGTIASHMVDAVLVNEGEIATRLPVALMTIIDGDHYPQMSAESQEKVNRLFTSDANWQPFAAFARRLGLDPGHST